MTDQEATTILYNALGGEEQCPLSRSRDGSSLEWDGYFWVEGGEREALLEVSPHKDGYTVHAYWGWGPYQYYAPVIDLADIGEATDWILSNLITR
jgi:hypothetical protein